MTRTFRGFAATRGGGAAIAILLLGAPAGASQSEPLADTTNLAPSSAWLSRLPAGATKRQFILDCTGCHQFDQRQVLKEGRPRTVSEWTEDVRRMLGFAGPKSGFPVISAAQDAESTAAWLVRSLGGKAGPPPVPAVSSDRVTEFAFPVPNDLPHDLAVEASGRVIVTGMFSHKMHAFDPASGRWSEVDIPVPQANPRALEIDPEGRWWVVLGGPGKLARYDGAEWKLFDVGLYAHSVALGADGAAFANGHFTRDPEAIVEVSRDGTIRTHHLPLHPAMARAPGGPIPYEIRTAPDGRIWMSELQGNRIVALDPKTGKTVAVELPTANSGPRRFDVDPAGVLWIPAYGAGTLVRYDPASGKFEELTLPLEDAAPYVVRVDRRSGRLWIATGAADALFEYDPKGRRFTTYPLPSRGALVRHLDIDRRTGDVWLAYGESPGKLPARIARLRGR